MEIHSIWLHHIAKEFECRVSDATIVDKLLAKAELKRCDLDPNNERIDAMKEAQFIRATCDYLKDPAFAAEAGLSFASPTHIVGYIVKSSKTLRDAIENAVRYAALVDGSLDYSLKVSGNYASMEFEHIDGAYCRFHRRVEFAIFCVIARIRGVTGVNLYPLEIRFRHPLRTARDQFGKLAGCPVHFGAEKTEIILSLSCLDLPIPTYDPNLRRYLKEYSDRLLAERPDRNISLQGKIERIVLSGLPGRVASVEEVASDIGLSRRSLARRLNEQGLGYREIVDGIRCDLAQTYLKGGFSIGEISFYLDYANQAAFSTAFKRWTGATPKSYQMQNALVAQR